jgi:hypothetical protein
VGVSVGVLVTRNDQFTSLIAGAAALVTALTLTLNTRSAMRSGWRGQAELDDDDGGDDDVPTQAISTFGDAQEAAHDRELEAPANDQ